jgi:cysteine desulfurase/selenocysteine lyase
MAEFNVEKIRKDFPILQRRIHGKPLVYLDNAATTQKPRQVISAICKYYEKHNANVHRGVHTLSAEATDMVEKARDKIAAFIGASRREEVIFVRNATEAANLILYSWGEEKIKPGDGVVVTFLEHHSNFVGWQQLTKKKQAVLKVVDISREGKLVLGKGSGGSQRGVRRKARVLVGSLRQLLDEKVKLVAVTSASNVLGTIVPIREVVSLVRKHAPQAVVLVDGAQAVPHMPVDVKTLGADFLIFSGHKMLGPTGIGVLWGRRKLLEEMSPFLFGGEMISEVELSDTVWNRLPWKFEAGTPNMAGIVGLGAAVDYLRLTGMERIREHERKLVTYALPLMEKLEKEGIIEFYGVRNADERVGVLSFNVVGVHAHDTAQVLDSYGIAVRSGHHCAMPLTKRLGTVATVRASFYLYNTKDEIDILAKGIRKVPEVFRL